MSLLGLESVVDARGRSRVPSARSLDNIHAVAVADLNSTNIRHVDADAAYEKTEDITLNLL